MSYFACLDGEPVIDSFIGEIMKIKIKKLHPDAQIPQYATTGSSGFDLVAIEDVELNPGETKLVKTGLSVDVSFGYELQVRPRSGLSLKTPLRVANAPGTVDSDFRGEVCVIMTNTSFPSANAALHHTQTVTVKKGDRIAQGVICAVFQAEIQVVESLDETDRGSGGFGSTGK
jgi:dUTP pyrophosphatase